ncbi:MAG: ATP--guanido phosphotransferase [Peptoniphilaceae bacterium]|nr:ATP--guanido phosphotransferase [Peptoniphilaceae bacterium]MDY3738607.1 ATP--guanido phosphotransferase [Peptoniphilaceae bacterium]
MREGSRDIILNSSLKLRRNIKGFKFPSKMSYEDSLDVIEMVKPLFASKDYFELDELDEKYIETFISERILSPDYEKNDVKIAFIILDDFIITLNDEDHITINVSDFGENLLDAYSLAKKIEKHIDNELDFSFDPEFGYLTSNAGFSGNGIDLKYKLFLYGILANIENYIAVKATLAKDDLQLDKFLQKDNENTLNNVFILSLVGNYSYNFFEKLEKIQKDIDVIVSREKKFRNNYSILYGLNDDDALEKIEILKSNLKSGKVKSLAQMNDNLYSLKMYQSLGYDIGIDSFKLNDAIFEINKIKYEGNRNQDRYEFLLKYMEEI